jgi:hypothetical protein
MLATVNDVVVVPHFAGDSATERFDANTVVTPLFGSQSRANTARRPGSDAKRATQVGGSDHRVDRRIILVDGTDNSAR